MKSAKINLNSYISTKIYLQTELISFLIDYFIKKEEKSLQSMEMACILQNKEIAIDFTDFDLSYKSITESFVIESKVRIRSEFKLLTQVDFNCAVRITLDTITSEILIKVKDIEVDYKVDNDMIGRIKERDIDKTEQFANTFFENIVKILIHSL